MGRRQSTSRTPRVSLRDQIRATPRVTGRELAARAAARRDQRRRVREARTADQRRQRATGITAIILIGILVASAAIATHVTTTLTTRIAHTRTALDELRSTTNSTPGPSPQNAALLQRLVASATTVATQVRDAQQRYATLFAALNTDTGGDGAPSQAAIATATHRRDLAPFFDPSSFIASDQDAYQWQDATPFDEYTQIDPRWPWYVYYTGSRASAPSTYQWTVSSVMPVITPHATTLPAQVRVVWECRLTTPARTLLAVASALFTPRDTAGVFSDLTVTFTSDGAAHHYPTVTTGGNR